MFTLTVTSIHICIPIGISTDIVLQLLSLPIIENAMRLTIILSCMNVDWKCSCQNNDSYHHTVNHLDKRKHHAHFSSHYASCLHKQLHWQICQNFICLPSFVSRISTAYDAHESTIWLISLMDTEDTWTVNLKAMLHNRELQQAKHYYQTRKHSRELKTLQIHMKAPPNSGATV